MAFTYNNLPIAAPNGQRLTIGKSLVVMRKRCRELSEATKAIPVIVELTRRKARAVIERNGGGWRLLSGVAHNQAAGQELCLRHIQVTSKTLT